MATQKQKCGCPDCKREHIPVGRNAWKSRKNRKGYFFGMTRKVTKGKHKEQGKRSQIKNLK